MKQDDINVLQELNDQLQYPATRCALEPAAFMYQRSSSQTVEAINNANKRVRTSVDVVNATMLLLKRKDTTLMDETLSPCPRRRMSILLLLLLFCYLRRCRCRCH